MEQKRSDIPYELTKADAAEEDTTPETQPKDKKLRRLGYSALAGLITYGALKSGNLDHVVPRLIEQGPYGLIAESIAIAELAGIAYNPRVNWRRKK